MAHDPVRYALWIGGLSLAVALFCGAYIAWVNQGSRNLILGLGAVAGASVILVFQAVFELKGTRASEDFVVEFVVDYQQKDVRSSRAYDQSMAVASSYQNVFIEDEASKIVAKAIPRLTKDDAPRIARDLGIVSIVSYLLDQQFDWQLDTRSLKTSTGTITQWQGVSTAKECSSISLADVREKLQAAGNIFASVQLGTWENIALPPADRSVRNNTELRSNSKLCMQRYFYPPGTVCEHDVLRPPPGSYGKGNKATDQCCGPNLIRRLAPVCHSRHRGTWHRRVFLAPSAGSGFGKIPEVGEPASGRSESAIRGARACVHLRRMAAQAR